MKRKLQDLVQPHLERQIHLTTRSVIYELKKRTPGARTMKVNYK
jgi:hypothetical protein